MSGAERQARVAATFYMPAVLETLAKERDWKYSGLRFVITDTADEWLVRHVLDTVRT